MIAHATLSHLAFFEALAAEPDEQSARWRQLSAGLLALRLFDGWLRHVTRGELAVDPARLSMVRLAVEAMEPDATERPVLLGLLDAILAPGRRVDVVRGHLLAYAKRLQLDGSWRLAADVYRTFVESRHPHDLSGDAMEAAFQCGYCYRMAGDIDEAAVAYDLGEAIAIASRDTFGQLRARVGQAKLTAHRGNLPKAEEELDAVIRAAEEAGCERALSLALSDRMAIAGRRGQYEEAATFGYRALRICRSDVERERILSDIATALGDAGHRQAARDAHLVLMHTARDRSMALVATANLLVLAVEDGDELSFERYRRALAEVALPAELHARSQLAIGDGYRRFGHDDQAVAAYETALAVAEQHALNDVVITAEAALRAMRQRPATRAPAAERAAGGVTIAEVIDAMRTLRESMSAAR
jgi:tetratricopeptide (TPR) repeat protein